MPSSPDLALINQYQPKFESQWRRLAQQGSSRLGPAVTVQSGCTGDVIYRDQIKPIDVLDLGDAGDPTSGRFQPIAISEIETQKRANYPSKFYVPKHFDRADGTFLKEQSVPTSQTFTEMKAGFNRKQEQLIIAAATGIARTGINGSVATELPAEQIIDVQLGASGNTGFNLDKWLATKELMEKAEVFGQDVDGGDAMAYIALTSKQLQNLYKLAQITSSDYAGELKALYRGEIDQFLGFKVIRTELLAKTGNIRTCFAWVKSGIALDIWENPKFEVDKRTDYTHPWQLVGYGAMGATRMEENKVVAIPCDESV